LPNRTRSANALLQRIAGSEGEQHAQEEVLHARRRAAGTKMVLGDAAGMATAGGGCAAPGASQGENQTNHALTINPV